jgi:hypothetical protein
MKNKKLTNVGIIGPNGIGLNHARIYSMKGINIQSILSSSHDSAQCAVDIYKRNFGIKPIPFTNIEEMISSNLDAVSICSPYEYHLNHIINSLDNNIPVFCEKPLFWDDAFTFAEVKKNLLLIKNHSMRKIFTNTCNTVFVEMLADKLPKNITYFKFIYHTQGKFTDKNIAIDLLPHGISFILHLFGFMDINNFKYKMFTNNFYCSFRYGEVNVDFEFQEKINGKKQLSFFTNDIKFERLQRGKGNNYVVSFKNSSDKTILEMKDPFEVYISKFVDYYNNGAPYGEDNFNQDEFNLLLMGQILEGIKNK